jgi:hypothetical protein
MTLDFGLSAFDASAIATSVSNRSLITSTCGSFGSCGRMSQEGKKRGEVGGER